MQRDSIVTVTSVIVTVLRVLNLVIGLTGLLLLIASWPFEATIAAKIAAKYRGAVDPQAIVWAVRTLILLALAGVAVFDRVLRELGGVLATLRAGDPFAAGNAARITNIAWALLVLQLLELVLDVVSTTISRLGAETIDWVPSVGGWLAVLFAFVLARVFAAGSRMRDELAATI